MKNKKNTIFKILIAPAILMIIGLLLLNVPLIMSGLLALLILGTVTFLPLSKPKIKRTVSNKKLIKNDIIAIETKIEIDSGLGIAIICDKLENGCEVVEGKSVILVYKGFGKITIVNNYKVKFSKRGYFQLEPTDWTTRNILSLGFDEYGVNSDKEVKIEVAPRSLKIENISILGERYMPENATVNAKSINLFKDIDEFREIRFFQYGDGFKQINWNASAKSPQNKLYVNDYDKLISHRTWIFLDTSEYMEIDGSANSPMEDAIELTYSMFIYLLKLKSSVGLHISSRKHEYIRPYKHAFRIIRELLINTKSAGKFYHLAEAVRLCKNELLNTQPDCYLITRFDAAEPFSTRKQLDPQHEMLLNGIRELRKLLQQPKMRTSIKVINIPLFSYPEATDNYQGIFETFSEAASLPIVQELKKLNIKVVNWLPNKHPIHHILKEKESVFK